MELRVRRSKIALLAINFVEIQTFYRLAGDGAYLIKTRMTCISSFSQRGRQITENSNARCISPFCHTDI